MDALSDHLRVLSFHWLANVKDAVRLNQVGERAPGWGIECGLTNLFITRVGSGVRLGKFVHAGVNFVLSARHGAVRPVVRRKSSRKTSTPKERSRRNAHELFRVRAAFRAALVVHLFVRRARGFRSQLAASFLRNSCL